MCIPILYMQKMIYIYQKKWKERYMYITQLLYTHITNIFEKYKNGDMSSFLDILLHMRKKLDERA